MGESGDFRHVHTFAIEDCLFSARRVHLLCVYIVTSATRDDDRRVCMCDDTFVGPTGRSKKNIVCAYIDVGRVAPHIIKHVAHVLHQVLANKLSQ